jgi:hypothetical protein
MSDQQPAEHTSHGLAPIEQARELLELAQTDRRAAELAFEQLGFDKQLDTALALTGDDLHEWLMLSGDLTELVRALPPEHLHHAIRLIGEEDAIDLLQAASSEQMQQMTDIEWFTEGKLDHKKVRRWLELLMELNEDEADQALQGLDVNALADYLRRKVKPAVDKDNLLLALHLNQRFLFTPEDLQTHDDLVEKFLNYLYAVDRDLFGEMLGLIIGEEEDIVAADMYSLREDRLIKRGFPAQAEAEFLLEIKNASAYGITWPKLPDDTADSEQTALQTQPVASAPFLLHALAWGRSRKDLGERTEREFIKESASLANSLLLAHSKDAGNPEAKSDALLAVQVLGSVALEALAFSQLPVAVEKLKSLELRELFQLGWSLTREVARDAWLIAMDDRIQEQGLQRNLKWLPNHLREAILEAEDLMSWKRIAATARPPEGDEAHKPPLRLLTWARLCQLRHAVSQAQNLLQSRAQ